MIKILFHDALRMLGAAAILLSLTGCYCMPDRGDANPASGAYYSGCWAEASKNKGKY